MEHVVLSIVLGVAVGSLLTAAIVLLSEWHHAKKFRLNLRAALGPHVG